MKKSSIIIIALVLFIGFKYFNSNKGQSKISTEEKDILSEVSDVLGKGDVDLGKILDPKQEGGLDLGELLNEATKNSGLDLDGMLDKDGDNADIFSGFKDMLGDLKEDKEMQELFGEIAQEASGISDNEMDILSTIPETNYKIINSEDQAQNIYDKFKDINLDKHINGIGSDGFKEEIKRKKHEGITVPKKVLALSKKAKEQFEKYNKNFSFGENVGKGYTGKNSMIYLPLGEKSFADEVIDYRKNEDIKYSMENSLGPPNFQGTFMRGDNTIANLGIGGQLTLKFTDNALVDIEGNDLYVFEIGAIEPTLLEVSINGFDWIEVGQIKGGTAAVDINGKVEKNTAYNYVRLTDLHHKSSLPGADIDAVAAIGSVIKLNINAEVLFDFGKSNLSAKGIKAVKELALQLKDIKQGKVNITGHTDDIGSDVVNKKLSLERAKSVSRAIQSELKQSQLTYKETGKGKSSPVVPNDSDANREKNRRVEITVIPI